MTIVASILVLAAVVFGVYLGLSEGIKDAREAHENRGTGTEVVGYVEGRRITLTRTIGLGLIGGLIWRKKTKNKIVLRQR